MYVSAVKYHWINVIILTFPLALKAQFAHYVILATYAPIQDVSAILFLTKFK